MKFRHVNLVYLLASVVCLPCFSADFDSPKTEAPNYYTLAKGYFQAREFDKAIEAAQHGLERAPDLLGLQIIKGQALDAIGRPAEALAVWEAMSDFPEPAIFMSMARDLRLLNHSKKALFYANKAIRLAEDGFLVPGSMGSSLFAGLGNEKSNSVDVPSWFYIERALILLQLHDNNAAVSGLERVELELKQTQSVIRKTSRDRL